MDIIYYKGECYYDFENTYCLYLYTYWNNAIIRKMVFFNTMSKDQKEKYDVLALCKFMGKIMFLIAFSISLFILSDILSTKTLLYVGIALLTISAIVTVIYTNTGNRFKL